jgi:hypothetical protein
MTGPILITQIEMFIGWGGNLTFDSGQTKMQRKSIREKETTMGNKLQTFAVIAGLAVLAFVAATGCKKGTQAEDYAWVTIDENYTPQNYVEEFIKSDSEQKGLFPVYIKNYGKDKSILGHFRGANFAKPNEARLNMAFSGLEDWMLVDIKYNNEKKQEVLRTVLYVQIEGTWRVGDSGSLLK